MIERSAACGAQRVRPRRPGRGRRSGSCTRQRQPPRYEDLPGTACRGAL